VVVGDPNFAPMYAQRSRRVKTDRRDARALMGACKLGAYKPAHRCSDVRKRVRARISARDLLVQARTKCISLVRAFLRQEGIKPERKSSSTFAARVRELGMPVDLAVEMSPVLDLIDTLTAQIRRADERVAEVAKDETHQRLMSVPGVGPVTAVAFVAALDDSEALPGTETGPRVLWARPAGAQLRREGAARAHHETGRKPHASPARPGRMGGPALAADARG
jgi:transposase